MVSGKPLALFGLALLLFLSLSPSAGTRPTASASAPLAAVEPPVAAVAPAPAGDALEAAPVVASGTVASEPSAVGAQVEPSAVGAQVEPTAWVEPTLFRRSGWHAVPRHRVQVPIFMYHYIRINPNPADVLGFNLSVPPADLATQLAYLADRGYQGVGLEEVTGFLSGRQEEPPPPRSAVLTFDDGYRDSYEAAYPLLKRYGFRATIFVISGLVGRSGYLTWPQLRQMAADGITIGAHTIGHPDLTYLSRANALREIGESKLALEKELDRPVLLFAYPSGRYNQEVVEMVKAAGYEAAVTVNYGLWHAPEDRYTLARVRVSGGQSLASLMTSAGLGPAPPSARPAANSSALRPVSGPVAE